MIGGKRLSPRSRRTSAAVVSWLIGLLVAVLLVRAMINSGISIGGGLVGLLVTVLWLVFWWRAARTGVFVSHSHVSVRGLLTTRTVPLGSATRVDAMAHKGIRQLVIHTTNGRHITTALYGLAAESDDNDDRPDVLPAAEFDRVLANLRMRVNRAPRTRPKERKRRQPRPSEEKPEAPEDLPPGMIERRAW